MQSRILIVWSTIDHFAVGCLVGWPLNGGGAGVGLVKPNCFSHTILVGIHIRKAVQFHKVDSGAPLSFGGRAAEHTTVEWSIGACRYLKVPRSWRFLNEYTTNLNM